MAVELPPVPPQQQPYTGSDGRITTSWYQYEQRLREFLKELDARLKVLEP